MKTILVTGSAGFIGSNLVLRLFKELNEGIIVGLDNLNDYYDPFLKYYPWSGPRHLRSPNPREPHI